MKKSKQNAAPATSQVPQAPKEARPVKFVVVREGHRVSDREYDTNNDPAAHHEVEFWSRVANNHSYGEPVEVVQYDPKKHRVFVPAFGD